MEQLTFYRLFKHLLKHFKLFPLHLNDCAATRLVNNFSYVHEYTHFQNTFLHARDKHTPIKKKYLGSAIIVS